MNRRILVSLFVLTLVAAGVGGYLAWDRYAVRRHWSDTRPVLPESAGEAAPGLDARFAGCISKLEGWPPDRTALAEFSQLCQANGYLPEAIQGYQTLMTVDPTEGRWPHLLAAILSGSGRLEEASILLQLVTQLAPDQTICWLRLADAQMKFNRTSEAESAYQEILIRDPSNAHALFGLARCDLQAGRLTAARSRLQQAVIAKPDFPGAQSLLAMVFEQLGNTEAAELARKRVSGDGRYTIAPDPWALDLVAYCHNPYTLLTAASAEASDGSPKDALPLLNRALQLAPTDARLHRQLANTLYRLNDRAGGLAEMEKALGFAKDDEKIRTDLIKMLRDSKEFARLETVVFEGTTTNPDSASLHFEAGRIAAQAGRADQAIAHLSLVWKLRPEETVAPCELAALYFGARRNAEGLAVLEAVLKSHPNDRAALTLLVRHGIESGDPRTGGWLKLIEAQADPSPGLAELHRSYQRRFGTTP